MPESAPTGYRDLPEWQAARAEYLSEDGDRDQRATRRVRAAARMFEIEKAAFLAEGKKV